MSNRGLFAGCAFASLLAVAAASSCATPPQRDERVDVIKPSAANFKAVNQLLVHQCGTLDCHGSRFRNLRVYGALGLRLPGNTPGDTNADPASDSREHLTDATPEEDAQSYLSLTGLEPEILSEVVASGGASPERLTFIRKARGTENHKGYDLVQPGTDADVCLLSFLTNAVAFDPVGGDTPCQRAAVSALACDSPSSCTSARAP